MSESYAYIILDRKTKRLRKETGNPDLRSALDTGRSPRDLFIFSIIRPTKMLFLSPIVFLLSLYTAVVYGYLYLLFTTITEVFEQNYGFSQGSVGLAYLGIGVGSLLGLGLLGASSDRILAYLTKKNGGVAMPEYRLPPLMVGAWFVPLGLFWYGWTAEKHLAWILPILGTGSLGVGMLTAFVCLPFPRLSPLPPYLFPFVLGWASDSLPGLLIMLSDVHLNLSRRRLHRLFGICHGSEYCLPITGWCLAPAGR